jgi:hypothetical protein
MVATLAAAQMSPGVSPIGADVLGATFGGAGLASERARGHWHTDQDDARLLRYRRFLDFDNARQDVARLSAGNVALVANYARTFVRKGASYLMPEPVALAVDPPEDTDAARAAAARAEKALARVTLENDLGVADLTTAVDAGVLGDGAFKVTWSRERNSVRVVPVDPQTLFIESAHDDVHEAVVVRQVTQQRVSDAAAFYGVNFAITANHVTVVEEWHADRYRVLINDVAAIDAANPYGWIPYVIFPNERRPHDFWGVSDIVDVMEINRQLSRRISVLAALLDISGSPVTVLENVTGQAGVTVAPGAVWEIPEDAKAYVLNLLEGGIIEQHIHYIEALYRIMDDVAEMPRMSFGEAGQARSGVALAVQLQPIIQKTGRKRLTWGGVYQRRAMRALDLLRQRGGLDLGPYAAADFAVRPQWAPVLPSDQQAVVADAIDLYQAGLWSQARAMGATGVADTAAEIAAIEAAGGPPATQQLAGSAAVRVNSAV